MADDTGKSLDFLNDEGEELQHIEYAPAVSRPTGREIEVRELLALQESGALRVSEVKEPIKLTNDAPRLVVAIPTGSRDVHEMHQCPHCLTRQAAKATCAACGKEYITDHPMRTEGVAPVEMLMNGMQMHVPMLCKTLFAARKGTRSSIARDEMTHWAMSVGAKYIFYWDDDVILPPNTWVDMYNTMEKDPDIAILTGVYMTKQDIGSPVLFKHAGAGAYWGYSSERGVVEDVYAAGGGCMMARIDAIKEAIELYGHSGWKDEITNPEVDNIAMRGHDVQFCHQMHTLRESGASSRPWRVCVAGWINCWHFDVSAQKMFPVPPDSPCFKKKAKIGLPVEDLEELHAAITEAVPSNEPLLDLGCGDGELLQRIINQRHVRATGVDIDPAKVASLRERHIDAQVADIGAEDFGFSGAPNVLVSEVLDFLSDEAEEYLLSNLSGGQAKTAVLVTKETKSGEHSSRSYTRRTFKKKLLGFFSDVAIKVIKGRLLAVCK